MISRGALIIGSPDENIPGVYEDIKNLKSHLKSSFGGAWNDNEIETLLRPDLKTVESHTSLLTSLDYSFIYFAGHGYYSNQKDQTIIQLNENENIESNLLKTGALKHTLILDCCRERTDDEPLKEAMESLAFKMEKKSPNRQECRKFFDEDIENCAKGIVVMHGCSVDETCGEAENLGGYYTSSLIKSAKKWAENKICEIDLAKDYCTMSTYSCHNLAATQVRQITKDRQNPVIEAPRTKKRFPFAIVA